MLIRFTLALGFIFAAVTFSIAQDSQLRILEEPLPQLPKDHASLDVSGSVILRVQFQDFGDVGEVQFVSGLSQPSLKDKAIEAAKKIKYEPQKRNGQAVTVYKNIEYLYSWNTGWRLPSLAIETRPQTPEDLTKAQAIIDRALNISGGEKYLRAKTQYSTGKYSTIKDGATTSYQTFTDAIVFPDKERTEFKAFGAKTIQVNTGESGWIYDGAQEIVKLQTPAQIAGSKQSQRTSLDNLLRGYWKDDATLAYLGRRPGGLGRRNDAIRLTFKDGFAVEFEFSVDDGLAQKAIYKTTTADGEDLTFEDRYAQYVETLGVKVPYIVDRFANGKQISRINYDSVEFDRPIAESVFAKPADAKAAKKNSIK